jgi:hypothetical protein
MEEEPDAVGEKKVRLRCQNYDSEEIVRILEVAFEIEGAKLWDEELEVISENTVEIRVDPAFLEVFNGPMLMSVHPHHRLRHDLILFPLPSILEVQPFLKPRDKRLFRDLLRFFAAYATTEHIIKAAARPEQACGLRVLFFFRDDIIKQLFPGCFVVRV